MKLQSRGSVMNRPLRPDSARDATEDGVMALAADWGL